MAILSLILMFLILSFVVFFFWASSGILNSTELLFTRNRPHNPSPPEKFKILTYNIGYASGSANNLRILPKTETLSHLNTLRTFFEQGQYDFILLQEVDLDAHRSGHIDQAEYLSDKLYSHLSIGINWDKNYVPFPYGLPQGHFRKILAGQVTFSRFPIQKAIRHVFEKPQENSWVKNAFYLDRLALITEIKLKNEVLTIVNIHLEAFAQSTRERQAKDLRSLLENYKNSPLIVAGDFNAPESEPIFQILTEDGFLKRPSAYGFSEEPTFTSWEPTVTLDHILVTSQIQLTQYSRIVVPHNPSDHLPVFAEFTVKG